MAEFIYFVRPTRVSFPGDASEAEMAIIDEHVEFLKRKLDSGELILVGRTQDEQPVGVCIFEAPDLNAAYAFAKEDPAVAKGMFKEEVRPYSVFLMRGRGEGS